MCAKGDQEGTNPIRLWGLRRLLTQSEPSECRATHIEFECGGVLDGQHDTALQDHSSRSASDL